MDNKKYMASSLFSKKQFSGDTSQQKLAPNIAIYTMQDDLRDVASGGGQRSSKQSMTEGGTGSGVSLGGVSPLAGKLSNRENEVARQSESPFGVVSDQPKNTPSNFMQSPVLDNGLRPLIQNGKLLSSQPVASHKSAWIISAGVFLMILLLAGVGWYFFVVNKEIASEPSVAPGGTNTDTGSRESLAVKQSPFSLDKPNYLSLNTETVSPIDVRKILSETADRIKVAGISVPVEFFVTDQNNNPLAFSRFAFLLDLSLDTDLLALIQEAFSLYAYNDNGNVRLGLALDLKNTEAAALLAKTETDVPYALRALILEPDVTVAKKSVFRSAAYNQFSIRFTNIDSNQNISLDYSLYNNRLFIGMSKNTLRVLLDTYVR